MPAAMSLSASTGLFEPIFCSPASPPGSKGPGPCRVRRTSLCDDSRNGQQGSCSPLFGLICGDGLRLCLPFSDNDLDLCAPSCGNTSSSRSASRGGISTSRWGSPCGGVVRWRSPFRGGGSWLRQPSGGRASGGGSYMALLPRGKLSTSHPASPCAHGTSASSLAAVAISASLAGSTPAVPSARAGATPTTGNAPPRSCALTFEV